MVQYDPCGFISPVILTGKILMQTIAGQEHNLDKPLLQDTVLEWASFMVNARDMQQIEHLPRLKTDILQH